MARRKDWPNVLTGQIAELVGKRVSQTLLPSREATRATRTNNRPFIPYVTGVAVSETGDKGTKLARSRPVKVHAS